jgi:hypothetical protein
MSEDGLKKVSADEVPVIEFTLVDGTKRSIASGEELPVALLPPDFPVVITMHPYTGKHILVKSSLSYIQKAEADMKEHEDFENTTFLSIKKNFVEALKDLPEIYKGVQEGDLAAMQRYQDFMEDCCFYAIGNKMLKGTPIMVLLKIPGAGDTQLPVFKIL